MRLGWKLPIVQASFFCGVGFCCQQSFPLWSASMLACYSVRGRSKLAQLQKPTMKVLTPVNCVQEAIAIYKWPVHPAGRPVSTCIATVWVSKF